MKLRYAAIAVIACGCSREDARRSAPVPSASAQPACELRTAEKLGFPFVRVCPPGEAGFWINAAPMGCSAGDHETVPCPPITATSHAWRPGSSTIRSSIAAMTDKETAARVCFMRMGGHLASRAERSAAQRALGLASVLVTESDASAMRFRFQQLPEWVVEESGEACESGLPAATCHFGWFPSTSRGTAIPWPSLRACSARYDATPPAERAVVTLGSGCAAPGWSWPSDGERDLPCMLRSAALDARGAPSPAAFAIACATPTPIAHPQVHDDELAAYRCVLPDSALGTVDPK